MEKQKKEYPISQSWRWYYGNYCVKKCRDINNPSHGCCQRMEEFCDKNANLRMTHREFVELFASQMKICRFDEKERRRMPAWKEVVLKEGECHICKKLGMPQW